MSKVGGALPSWYWPDGIPRRASVSQQPLSRLLRQRLVAAKDQPAIWTRKGWIHYGELLECALALAGGIQAAGLPGTLAIVEAEPAEALLLLLGGLFADKEVFLCDAATPPAMLAAQLAEAKTSVILTATGAGGAAAAEGVQTMSKADLNAPFRESARPKRAIDGAVLLASERGVVLHSNFSLSAMCTSLHTFIPVLRQLTFICAAPLGSWEGMSGALGALLQGTSVAFVTLEELKAGICPPSQGEVYTMLRRQDLDQCLSIGSAPPVLRRARYVFVSTGSFSPTWRRHIERECGRPILPVWGLPEVGPVVAPHPTWFPRQGHGFPIVNVSLHPIDPASGKVCIVPWEMLECAEVGIEALSAMVGYTQPEKTAAVRIGKVIRTHQIAGVDHVGVVTLQKSVGLEKAGSAHV